MANLDEKKAAMIRQVGRIFTAFELMADLLDDTVKMLEKMTPEEILAVKDLPEILAKVEAAQKTSDHIETNLEKINQQTERAAAPQSEVTTENQTLNNNGEENSPKESGAQHS